MSSNERHRRTLGPKFEMTPEKRDRSNLAVPSPSIRRSSRLQDSPSVNYNVSIMSKRNGTSKRHTNKRIFGLDASDMNNTSNNTSNNLSLNNISAAEETQQLNSSKGKETADLNVSLFDKLQSSTQHKLSGCSQSTKMLIASLTFVLMLFIAEQSVYYLYLTVCWSASSLSQVRTMFLSFPEIISSHKDVHLPSSESDGLVSIVQDLKLKFEEDIAKLNAEVILLQLRNQDIENEKLQLLLEDKSSEAELNSQNGHLYDIIKDHVEEMSRSQYSSLLEKHEALSNQFALLTRTKDNSQSSSDSANELMREIEQIKETIRSIKTNSSSSSQSEENYISLALAKFPVLSTIGEKFENFESRTSRLEEKLNSDINLIIEKHSHNLSEHLEAQMISQVETLMKRPGDGMRDKLLDLANSELGTKVEAFNGTKTHPEALLSSLKLFGFSVWKQLMKPSMIIERPHQGRCWPFSGSSGSLLFRLPRKVPLKMVTLTQSSSLSSAKDIIVWDHDRKVALTSFSWNIADSDKQSFELENSEVVENLRIDILNNWGEANTTCVGEIQLLGTLEN